MRKGLIITGVILAVLAGGAYGVKSYISEQIGNEVVKLTQDPEVQKTINKAIEEGLKQQVGDIKLPETAPADGKASVPATAGGGQQPAPVISSQAEAVEYAQSKFSAAEIAELSTAYVNKEELSAAEKEAIKQQILSRFTPEELQALQQAVSK